MTTTSCIDCNGRGYVLSGTELRYGIAGSYEAPAKKICPACEGAGEIEAVSSLLTEANARLIAAAPELLEALEAVQRLDYFREHNGLAKIVTDAINKAKGNAE